MLTVNSNEISDMNAQEVKLALVRKPLGCRGTRYYIRNDKIMWQGYLRAYSSPPQ